MSQDVAKNILSSVIVYDKYARHIADKDRREVYDEVVSRNMNMHIAKYPQLDVEIREAYQFVFDKKVLPSMRSMQFGGRPIEVNNARLYNCSFLPIDDPYAFSETMFLLLSGCGVGYSVQKHHVDRLPEIRRPTRKYRYLVGDSIEGWADAVKVLMKAYFRGRSLPMFDFSDIRAKGTALITSGGKAPGPEPLATALFLIQQILDRKENGSKLTTLEAHDICCHIADAVLSGGIRRSAMIALFDLDDYGMLTCKFDKWYEENPQRALANNSAVVLRHKITEDVFKELWSKVQASNSGEPGIFFTNDKDLGTNPCGEISLKPFQFCNLTTINAADIANQEDLNARAKAAAFIGTLQASYTNFHYLRPIWKTTTEKEALIGVSMTGIAAGNVLSLNTEEAAKIVKQENERVAAILGINKAARCTTIKPEGTSSLLLGVSSGVHAYFSDYWLRRVKVIKSDPLYLYLLSNHPELLEDDYFKPKTSAFVVVPQAAPPGAITRSEPALDLLERVKLLHKAWIAPGHRKGSNTNNVSTTVTIKPDEWDIVGKWMWENRDDYTALAVLPYDDHTYVQTPFEEITKEEFEARFEHLKTLDLSSVHSSEDTTNLQMELACAGGACTIT